jgi:hypothetical protein
LKRHVEIKLILLPRAPPSIDSDLGHEQQPLDTWILGQHFTFGVAWRGKTQGNYTQFPESVNGNTPEACFLHPIHKKTVLKDYVEPYLGIEHYPGV